jgi:hypothetical protein
MALHENLQVDFPGFVIPAHAGIQKLIFNVLLDSRFRGNDIISVSTTRTVSCIQD